MPHSAKSISQQIAKLYPNCPTADREAITALAMAEQYRDIDAKTATTMSARVHARKTMTDYENLKQVEAMTRNEALLIVKDEVADIVKSWGR